MFNKKHRKDRDLAGELEDQFTDAAKTSASRANHAMRNSAKNVKDSIESNPFKCVTVVAVTALIIGFFLGRK
jgi:ElaB/YqjD/DUF883 family membrane-anchored ribosome-binding protein